MSTASTSTTTTSTQYTNPVIFKSEYMKPFMKYSVFLLFVLYFIGIFTVMSRDPYAMDGNKRWLYLFSVIGPMIFFVTIILTNMEDQRYIALVVCMIIVILFFVCRSFMPFLDRMMTNFFGYFTNVTEIPPLSIENSFLVSIVSRLLFVSIVVVFLSILFTSFFSDSFQQREKANIFMYAIFLIPCLVVDYVKYLLNEFKTTPTVVYVLIGVEIVLITLYFLIPKIFRMFFSKSKQCIVREPMYLDQKKTVSGMSPFYNESRFYKELGTQYNVRGPLESSDQNIPNKSLLRNYSISFWLTLNPPSIADDEECMIFRVENDKGSISDPDNPRFGVPYIGFRKNRLVIVCSNNIFVTDDFQNRFFGEKTEAQEEKMRETVSCELEIPYQKWNNLVLNYRNNSVDVFLNGELVNTVLLQNFLPIYRHSQTVCIGSDSGKIHGAICELCVYGKCLGQTEISSQYNLLNLKNPPVNNLT